METKEFKISINASKERVWDILWNDSTYRAWTSVFAEGSHAESDWQKGSKILFLDGKGAGMVSQIVEKIPNEFMSFKHLGEVKDGVQDTSSDKVSEWAGAVENYTLNSVNGKTELKVYMNIADEFMEYFLKTWPKALDKVKELAEKS